MEFYGQDFRYDQNIFVFGTGKVCMVQKRSFEAVATCSMYFNGLPEVGMPIVGFVKCADPSSCSFSLVLCFVLLLLCKDVLLVAPNPLTLP